MQSYFFFYNNVTLRQLKIITYYTFSAYTKNMCVVQWAYLFLKLLSESLGPTMIAAIIYFVQGGVLFCSHLSLYATHLYIKYAMHNIK